MTIVVSSWALHREIGQAWWNSPDGDTFEKSVHAPTQTDIRDLAPKIRAHGFDRIELCHFHLSSRESSYLGEVRSALSQAGIILQTLLIDDGNISDPEEGPRDVDWIRKWLEVALELGAEGARVIAGKNAWTEETFENSAKHLGSLSELGVRIRIENWFDLLKTPEHVFQLLDRLDGKVGLCMDFGNWTHPNKHQDLEVIATRAETCHAKAEFLNPAEIDANDFGACLRACRTSGYKGPYVLVNGGALPTEWEALTLQRDFILNF